MTTSRVGILLSFALLQACAGPSKAPLDGDGGDEDSGEDDASSDSGSDGAVSALPRVEQINNAICRALLECPARPPSVLRYGGRVADDCTEAADRVADIVVGQRFEPLEEAVDMGRLTVDQDELDSCLAGLAACAPINVLYECLQAYEGAGQVDDLCFYHQECVSGYCQSVSDACGGKCAANEGGVVFAHEVVGEGEDCGELQPGGGSYTHLICPEGFVCANQVHSDTATLGTCTAPIAVGGECSSDICVGGAACVQGLCRTFSVGKLKDTCNIRARDDDSDIHDLTAKYCDEYHRLECAGGVCELYSGGTESSPCAINLFHDCNPNLTCVPPESGDEWTCQPLRTVGQTCYENTACASGYCNHDTSQCLDACPAIE